MNPKISVVTVCFNAVEGVEKTILSVINQTYPDIEYIIIDGGSTDGTVDVIKKYADHISYWVSEPDKGIYDAMNKGIKAATGEWINFMNAGDCFVNSMVVQQMVGEIDSGIRILRGNIIRVYSNFKIKAVGVTKQDPGLIDMFDNTFHHQACFVQRSLFNDYGLYSTEYELCSDWKFFFECVVSHGVKSKYVDLSVAYFAMDGASSYRSFTYQKERENYLLNKYGEDMYKLLSELAIYRKSKLIRAYYIISSHIINYTPKKIYSSLSKMEKISKKILGINDI